MARSRSKNNNGPSLGSVPKISGRGDYKASINDLRQRVDRVLRLAPKGSFGRAGAAAGMAFGGPAGAAIGGALGRGVSAITGYGDYQVKQNSLSTMSTSMDTVPQFVRNDHAVRVIHREFVKDLKVPTSPSEFSNSTFVINPSNPDLFPWLSSLSKQYQQYNIRGMIVEFKSMSSDYAASGPLGTVAIATNYNVNDLPFSSKVALENSEFAVSCKPSKSLMHAIECDPEFSGRKYYYVRDPGTEGLGTSDSRLYDVGLLQIATTGLPGNSGTTLGEIWVSYDIEFTKPILPSPSVPGIIPTLPPGEGGDPGQTTLVSGFALTSQSDGTSSFEGGTMARVMYTQLQSYVDMEGIAVYPFGGSNPIVPSLDTGMNGVVCAINNYGAVTFVRDGYYTVTYTSYADFDLGTHHFSAPSLNLTSHAFVTASGATVSQGPAIGVSRHYVSGAKTDFPCMVFTISFEVSGCGPEGTAGASARLDPPQTTLHGQDLATGKNSTCVVTWTQLRPTSIVVPPP